MDDEQMTAQTIGELLDVDADEMQVAISEHLTSESAAAGLVNNLLADVAAEAAKVVTDQLRLDPLEVLLKSLCTVDSLRQHKDQTKYPPGEPTCVKWIKCSIKAPQTVDVKFRIEGIALPPLPLTLDLRGTFHSLVLTVQDAKIIRASMGSLKASAS